MANQGKLLPFQTLSLRSHRSILGFSYPMGSQNITVSPAIYPTHMDLQRPSPCTHLYTTHTQKNYACFCTQIMPQVSRKQRKKRKRQISHNCSNFIFLLSATIVLILKVPIHLFKNKLPSMYHTRRCSTKLTSWFSLEHMFRDGN